MMKLTVIIEKGRQDEYIAVVPRCSTEQQMNEARQMLIQYTELRNASFLLLHGGEVKVFRPGGWVQNAWNALSVLKEWALK